MTDTLCRSALYVPASNARAIEKASSLACDMVILDLEDAVSPNVKEEARAQAVETIRNSRLGRRALIRLNGLDTPWGAGDLDAIAPLDCGVLLPKIGCAADLEPYHAKLGGRPIWAMIETARATFRLEEIATAPSMAGLVFGGNDLAKELGNRAGARRLPFVAILTQIVAAARAFKLRAFDGVYNTIDDLEGFKQEARQAADLGFDGKTLIHPKQIEPCHRAFLPRDEDVLWARAICEAFSLPENEGRGAIRLNGTMVERLHLNQARDILALVEGVG